MPFMVLAALAAVAWPDADVNIQPPQPCPAPPTCMTCVREAQPRTKKVYACVRQAYCLPCCHCCLCQLFGGDCDCEDGPCGKLRFRHRLVVKRVPDCDGSRCVPREVPLSCPEQDCAGAIVESVPKGGGVPVEVPPSGSLPVPELLKRPTPTQTPAPLPKGPSPGGP